METTNRSKTDELAVSAPRQRGLLSGISPSSRIYWLRILAQDRVAVSSALFLFIVIILAASASILTPFEPREVDPISRLQGPSVDHWLGTDGLGRDILTRLLYGARVSLIVGGSVTLIAGIVGSVLGLVAGYYDRFDTPIMRVMDGMMAFPSILLAIAIMASLGRSTTNVIIALSIVYTPTIARLVRSTTLANRGQLYVESARAIGHRGSTILRKYIFANSVSPLIVQCTFVIAYAIISEASLSFLGVGVDPQTATWGNMLQEGQRLLQRAWWIAVIPGIALFLLCVALNLLGDGLRDALDPRIRER